MRKKGFIVKSMGEDGACLFRAVADQIYGDQEMHGVVRQLVMDYMVLLIYEFQLTILDNGFAKSNLTQFLTKENQY